VKKGKSGESEREDTGSKIEGNPDDEVDSLFKLPLAEFTGARNDLAARLKRGGHSDDSKVVKALAKPPVSAWAVNQLYWNHREAFDRLLAAGQRFHQAQASGIAGQVALRESLGERREALSHLSELAAALLSDAGHNPAPDTTHRITTTLEALSAYASLPDGPTPGRLTRDVDPPGFEALASLITTAGTTKAHEELVPVTPSQESGNAATPGCQEAQASAAVQEVREPKEAGHAERAAAEVRDLEDVRRAEIAAVEVRELEDARRAEIATAKVRELEEGRRARIAAAEISLKDARRSLTEATARAERLETAQKKADEEVEQAEKKANQAEKELREYEERLKRASAALEDAAQRSQSIAAEANEATKAMEAAKRNLERASKELESLLEESDAR